jgi:predicted Zn-dependent protease
VRTPFLSLTLVSSCALAQSPLIQILSSELNRNFDTLKQKSAPPPYFMAYAVTENDTDVIVASEGSIDDQTHSHTRYLDVTVRVGTPKFDNYHLVGGQRPRFGGANAIALTDDEDSIRRTVWLATDRVYRSAAQRLLRLQDDAKLRTASLDSSDDFSKEEPQVFEAAPGAIKFDTAAWADRLKKLSAGFKQYPGALNSSVQMEVRQLTQTLVTTDGTKLLHGRPFTRLIVFARGKAADGMDLQTLESFETDDPSKMPSDAEILEAVKKAGANLTQLLAAPLSEPYLGPAILSGKASGVLFHEIFGHRIEGHRQKDETEGQTFTKKVNEEILPNFLSVVFDPTRKSWGDIALNGYYQYDDEGVAARKVTIVDKGVLKTFLMSRSPVDGFPQSNGHGRRSPGQEIVPRQSNLIVESNKAVSDAELRAMLIAEVKRQNKTYGLYFDQVTGGYTTTGRQGLQAFTVMPLVVYQVFADGRPDQMIRGVDIVGTPLASFAKITATSDRTEVFNGICGAESGNVPVSAISPALLVSEIEVQRKERSQDLPPYLPRPTEGAGE